MGKNIQIKQKSIKMLGKPEFKLKEITSLLYWQWNPSFS